jgi:hypothetical protein
MTYESSADQRGATIDGVPDAVTPGKITWETVDGSQGGLSIAHSIQTDVPGLGWTSYYLDKQNPAGGVETQCTGDSSAYGSSGPWINQKIPNTDPRNPPFNNLTASRTLFFEGPGYADGPKQSAQAANLLQVSVAPRD